MDTIRVTPQRPNQIAVKQKPQKPISTWQRVLRTARVHETARRDLKVHEISLAPVEKPNAFGVEGHISISVPC